MDLNLSDKLVLKFLGDRGNLSKFTPWGRFQESKCWVKFPNTGVIRTTKYDWVLLYQCVESRSKIAISRVFR